MEKTLTLLIDGKRVTAIELKRDLDRALDDSLDNAVKEVKNELQKFLTFLQQKTTNRGRGRMARKYNNPLKDAQVEIKKRGEGYEVFVNHYLFNLLDEGRGSVSSPNLMAFPVYQGNLTKINSLKLSRVRVARKPRWVRVKKVRGFPGRNFYKYVLLNLLLRKIKTPSGRKSSKYFEFPVLGEVVKIEVLK